jgi:hypothetical protein
MGIRDEELKRVEKYCQALGIKVTYKKQGKTDPEAEWATDGSEITVYLRPKQSITQIILDLIHELGHHQAWVYNDRKTAISLDNALGREKHNKKDRLAILKDEENGAEYHLMIYKELGLKIPEWKVRLERDLSLEIYRYYAKNNNWPTFKWRKEKKKELQEKLK